MAGEPTPRGPRGITYLLLLLPFIGLLYPPFYNRLDPKLDGIPFFIWYQFAWIGGGALVMILAYRLGGREDV
jgi:hypothetical protein